MRSISALTIATTFAIAMTLSAATLVVAADEGMSPDLMRSLKASTVFVKTELGPISYSGSGFVIKREGDYVFIATNHHVVSKPKELQLGGYIPGLKGRDRFTLRRLQSAMADAKPVVSVVFNSGDAGEQVLKAEIVAGKDEPDLAILKVMGVQQKVVPLDFESPPELNETTPVFLFGFPFGDALATNKGNPAITIGKGSISSIRKDASGRIVKVQIDGALNPGNSGGPVVDNKGGLVGIAVQTIQGSNIGMAIYPLELRSLLGGNIGPLTLTTQTIANSKPTVDVTFSINDPFSKLRDLTLHYVPKAILLNSEQLDQPQIANIEGGSKVKPEIKGNAGRAELPLVPIQEPVQISLQASYVTEDGKTAYGRPQHLWIGVAADPAASSLSTVSNGNSSIVTRVVKTSGGFSRNVTTVQGNGSPPRLNELLAKIAKSNSAETAKGSGGFAESKTSREKKSKPGNDDASEPRQTAKTAAADKNEPTGADPTEAKEEGSSIQWTNNIKKMVNHVPDVGVGGSLAGVEFKPDRVTFQQSRLVMRQGDGFFADAEINMVLWKEAAEIAGKKCVVNGTPRAGDPSISIKLKKKGAKLPDTTHLSRYLLVLEFGEFEEETRTLSGKIYLCCPDESKSVCAGTFDASVE